MTVAPAKGAFSFEAAPPGRRAVPIGYKRTDIGVFPEDWEVKELRMISPAQSVGLVINPSTYFAENGTVPMLVGSNVGENKIYWETANRITQQSNSRIPASRLSAGDIVMVRVGDPGIAAVVPAELDGCNCASMMIVRKHDRFESAWLCSLMNSRIGRRQVQDVQYGTAQKQFNISDAIRFRYPMPSLSEQRLIAEALSDVDTLLEALDTLISKKRAIKQAAMQQLLTGKTRLCEFALRTSYVDSDLGQIPADWKCCAFGEVVDLLTGFPFPSSRYAASGVLLVRGSNVKRGALDWAPDITEYWAATTSDLVRYQLSAGDLVIAMDGALVGRSYAMISDADVPSLLLQRVARLRSATVDQRLLLYWVASDAFSNYVDSVKTHTAIPHISAEDIRRFRIVIPTNPAEQSAIATILSDMDAEITALEARRDKTRAIKQGMMQQLLTGRVRLVKPTQNNEAA